MSTSKVLGPTRSASIDDCVRLWSTLTNDFVPGLKLELEFLESKEGHTGIRVLVCDYAYVGGDVTKEKSIWAMREFYNPLHLISISQLFDLLISAYRVMEEYFSTGKENRPGPVKG